MKKFSYLDKPMSLRNCTPLVCVLPLMVELLLIFRRASGDVTTTTTTKPYILPGISPCGGHLLHIINKELRHLPGTRLSLLSRRYVAELRRLHDELFPGVYEDEFYQTLVENVCSTVVVLNTTSSQPEVLAFATGLALFYRPSNTVTGYVSEALLVQNDDRVHNNRTDWIRRIFSLGVVRRVRGQGVGRFVLQSLTDVFHRDYMVDLVELHVNADNHLAKTLYESCGFTEIKFIEDFYPEPPPPYGTAALQMVNYNTDYLRRRTGGHWSPFELRDQCFHEKLF